jgi:hypothetical protein
MSARRQWTMAVCAASLAGPAGADPAGVGLDDSGLGFRSAWEGHGAGVEGSFESMLRLAQATAEEVVDGSLAPPEGDASGEGAELPTGEELAEAGAPKTDLAAAAQNPIASTIRLPFESNLLINSGEDNETGFLLNIQPVLPMSISEAWNIIHRPIIPIMYTPGAITGNPANPGLAVGFDDTFGLGDINYTPFFSPKDSGEIIWGVGPSLSFPTATDDVLGSGKWSAGPSFVVLTIQKPFLGGVLFQHLWSFAGEGDRDSVNRTLIQPFLNYNMDDGWYLVTSPIITANWSADSGNRWTVPVGGGGGKLFRIGDQPINMSMQVHYNVERPTDGPEWQIQFTFMLLFPR